MSVITIRLSKNAVEPLYEQLYDYIKSQILNGFFPCGAKLPSKRQLSAHLECSQNTIQNAYDQLIAEGYIIAKPRSGFYVCELEGMVHMPKSHPSSYPLETKEPTPSFTYSFSHQGIDLKGFPFTSWAKIMRKVMSEFDLDLLKTGDSQGDPLLRGSIANYLHYSREVKCHPDQIIISSGTESLIQLLIQLFDKDCIYGLENPGYEKLSLIFKSNQATYKPIPLDHKGMLPTELHKTEASVICVTPSHQFPTGRIMPINRRIQLLNWANKDHNRYIIEDDYDSEFKYSGKPIPSLQGLDHNEKVIYIGSFSKSLNPGVRISYMVLPKQLLSLYHEKLSFYICPVPTFQQKVLYQFMDGGHFERHLNRMRNIYKKKRETLIEVVEKLLPNAEISGANAGLHLLLTVNNHMDEGTLISAAAKQGVEVYGISQYFLTLLPKDSPPTLLLGFATLKEEEIIQAVTLLQKSWQS